MDTRFRNEVYVVLARHESTFVQIQNTLQTIRDELQSLSFSQTQLSTDLPMFFDDTYVPVEVFIDFDKPPILDDYVFDKILYKSNSHFVDCFYESHISFTTQSTSLTLRFDRHTRHKLPFPNLGGDFLTIWINNNRVELPADLFRIYPCVQG